MAGRQEAKNNLKLGVEVISAHDLLPRDGEGSSSAFVELHFDGQKFRTTTKEKDLNPVWNETFYFNITDPTNISDLSLEAYVYCYNQVSQSKTFLGKIRLNGTSFVPYSDAVQWQYPLEKRGIFSRVRGELDLKVFLTGDPSVRVANSMPDTDDFRHRGGDFQTNRNGDGGDREVSSNRPYRKEKGGRRHTFFHLPNQQGSKHEQQQQQQPPQFFPSKSEASVPRVFQSKGGGGPSFMGGGDYSIKETSPVLGGGKVIGGRVMRTNKPVSTYDLVEKMQFLYVRVVKARDLPDKDVTGSLDPYVEVKIGNYKGRTRHFEKRKNPEWNEVFAFSRDRVQSSWLEVLVQDKDLVKDDYVGVVRFDLNEIPTRVPPDSPLAPQWYRLEDEEGEKISKGEIMLAVWYGTQADEAFSEAHHSDSIAPDDVSASGASTYARSKVYHSPRLWYLRVNVIEAQDLIPSEKTRLPNAYIKATIGSQSYATKPMQARGSNPFWNEDLMFVAAEPFEEHLIISVEDRISPNKEETLGRLIIPLGMVHKRLDDKNFPSRWYSLRRPSSNEVEDRKEKDGDRFASKLHMRISLDGGYHVFDEPTYYSSDLRPTARQLWKSSIGVLELGILNASGLNPVKTRDGRGTADTFCVAKYGQKWVRTRTIIDSLIPKYNEQYTWEVYDPATVLSIAMFDNGYYRGEERDKCIGKVRIRISTLEAGRVYTHSYPLLVLHPSGVKKMGELHLAIRFSCTSATNLMYCYSKPLLPKMHYSKPINFMLANRLRQDAIGIVASRLSRAEPPLKQEVVEYLCDVESQFWSMRRSKAHFYRIYNVIQGAIAVSKWFDEVCRWKNPVTTVLVHLLFVMLVCFPELILPTAFLYMFVIGLWKYRYRQRHPPHMDPKMSCADAVHPDELDEEFDKFPTTRGSDLVRWRYDRLRSLAGKVQTVLGDVAAQGERFQMLISWRDPRATTIFLAFCLIAACVLYSTPFQVMALLGGFYVMRHPKFRGKYPAVPMNFFRRLPSKADCML